MATVQEHTQSMVDKVREALGVTTVQNHDLSTADKVRMALGWALFILALPILLLVAIAVVAQIVILCAVLFRWLLSSIF